MLKFAVLGSGNGGRAFCAQIAAKGYPVTMWEPLDDAPDFSRIAERKEMFLGGDMNLGGPIGVTKDIAAAMKGVAVLLVVVPSFAHEPIFKKMIPLLQDGQHILIVPGNFGAYRLKAMMDEFRCTKKVTISCTETMPYACRIKSFDVVNIFKKKLIVHIATSPSPANKEVLGIFNDVFDGYVCFEKFDHPLMIDMSNVNFTLHPLPVLLNYGDIEKNPKTFRHYMDGITPLISEQMHRMDEERIEVGKVMGFTLTPTLEMLKMYYGMNETQTIYEYVNSPESPYVDLVGHNVHGRYLSEDVPGVVAPVAKIAEKTGLGAPLSSLVVTLASQLHGKDYWTCGTTLESLKIGDKSITEILDMMN